MKALRYTIVIALLALCYTSCNKDRLDLAPLSETEALVEIAIFSNDLLEVDDYDPLILDYINDYIGSFEYEILEKGKAGFMGLGKKPYRILVKVIDHSHDYMPELAGDNINSDDKNQVILNQDGSFKVRVKKQGIISEADLVR